VTGAAVLAVLTGALLVGPASAAPAPSSSPEPGPAPLSETAVVDLLPAAAAAAGSALAGQWFDPATSRLMIGTWDPSTVDAIGALGATPVLRTGPRLDPAALQRTLDERAAAGGLPPEVADYGVDEATQHLDVALAGPRTPAVDAMLAGIDPGTLQVRAGAGGPAHHADMSGGDTIKSGYEKCTLGFTARAGRQDWILTAGHCTRGNPDWQSEDGVPIGSGAKSASADLDAGAIPVTDPSWTPQPTVGATTVHGSREAPVGSTVCLTGATSGRVCGQITGRNRSVNFDGQLQNGMGVASLCSREGDSGGPYITAAGQAQGIHSGGGDDGGCASYFTPVGPALRAFGLTLDTA
jgi:streptogrisin C